jgi:hypothetical protein
MVFALQYAPDDVTVRLLHAVCMPFTGLDQAAATGFQKKVETRGSVTARPNRYSTLKWGLVALFIGASLLVVIPLQQFAWAQHHEGELITGIIFLAGGLAFLLYYSIVSKREKAEEL